MDVLHTLEMASESFDNDGRLEFNFGDWSFGENL